MIFIINDVTRAIITHRCLVGEPKENLQHSSRHVNMSIQEPQTPFFKDRGDVHVGKQ